VTVHSVGRMNILQPDASVNDCASRVREIWTLTFSCLYPYVCASSDGASSGGLREPREGNSLTEGK
jgi:hypothetical protein